MKIFKSFNIGGEVLAADFYVDHINTIPSALVLHGAGQSDRSRTQSLCENLLKQGITSLSIDFSGHGESTHNSPESIAKRIFEASNVLEKMGNSFSLFTFSMSGQVAISLAEIYGYRMKNMVLFCPAIYSEEALDIPFGEAFSLCIRQEESWKKSRCEECLAHFYGNLILITAEHDEVIPNEVPEIIFKNAIHAKNKKRIEVLGAPHTLGKWMNEHPKESEKLVEEILLFLN